VVKKNESKTGRGGGKQEGKHAAAAGRRTRSTRAKRKKSGQTIKKAARIEKTSRVGQKAPPHGPHQRGARRQIAFFSFFFLEPDQIRGTPRDA